MSEAIANVTIRILDKEFHVNCPADEEQDLLASADLVHRQMREIKAGGKVIGLDRVAVMVALNLANELLKLRGSDRELKNVVDLRIRSMRERLDAALEPARHFAP